MIMDCKQYAEKCMKEQDYWLLEDNVLVIRDQDILGRLGKKAIVLTPRTYYAINDPTFHTTLLLCSCLDSIDEHEILDKAPACFGSSIELACFAQKRNDKACLHVRVALRKEFLVAPGITYAQILQQNDHEIATIEKPDCVLKQVKPHLRAVFDDMSWGVLGPFGSKGSVTCCMSTCKDNKNSCSHLKKYLQLCDERNVPPELYMANTEAPKVIIYSYKRLAFHPLSDEL